MQVNAIQGQVDVKATAKKVTKAFEEDPQKLNALLEGKQNEVIRSVLPGQELSDDQVKEIDQELMNNNLLKLFVGANGQIDANDLVEISRMANDTSNPTRASGIAALLDGKLDVNDLLAIMGLLTGGNSHSNTSSLFSTLLGGGSSSNTSSSLLSTLFGAKPQQQQTNTTNSLLNALLGGSTTQTQQQTQAVNTNTLLNALFGGSTQAQTQQTTSANSTQNMLNSLFGYNTQQTTPAASSSSSNSLLSTLFSGSNSSNGQTYANQLFTLDTSGNVNSNVNVTNSNGTVDLSQLFTIAGQLLGK